MALDFLWIRGGRKIAFTQINAGVKAIRPMWRAGIRNG